MVKEHSPLLAISHLALLNHVLFTLIWALILLVVREKGFSLLFFASKAHFLGRGGHFPLKQGLA